LARTPYADSLWRGLGARGIAVRWFGEQPALRDSLRISCPGDPADFTYLRDSLVDVISETKMN
ncbi:MAG: hypothetical protein ACKO9H_19785, partial [Planctomycetota bacterium]